MIFSTKTEYGLRAIAHLDKAGKMPVSLAMIAKTENLSLPYLERLFAKLKKANIVKSKLGINGGYILIKPANQLNLFEVIEVLEGSLAPFSCILGETTCSCKTCRIIPVWHNLYKQIEKNLKAVKLNKIMN